MKQLFKRDPAVALVRAEADKAVAQAKLADLQRKRSQALLEVDEISEFEAIDRDIAAAERTILVLGDKVVALRTEQRRQRIEVLERERADGIAALQKKFVARAALAREVEEAVERLGSLWERLLASRADILDAWPATFVAPQQDELTSRIDRELAWALYAAGHPTALRPCSIPAPSNVGLGVAGVHPRGLAGAIEVEHEALLARLKNCRLPDDLEQAA